ncbi:MAG: SurA N-terminal domain-containing protein [Amoebophilaceae bacterium]|nr:SurA N-terminal domain-containing protein [Amoebophilaceae bacterium]
MAILERIRNKTGSVILVVVVFSLVTMMLAEHIGSAISYLSKEKKDYIATIDKDYIATIDGVAIHDADYHKYVNSGYNHFRSQGKPLTPENEIRLKNGAWKKVVENTLYTSEAEKISITVGAHELIDLVQGEHIDPAITAAFKDPQTGDFDKQKLIDYLSSLNKQGQEEWCAFEKELGIRRVKDKINKFMELSSFTTTEENKVAQHAKEICTVDYLYIPFASFDDDLVKPTNQQLTRYMTTHKERYKAKENKTIKYIVFPIEPSEKDNILFQEELTALTVAFSTATDPYEYAKQHTDGDSLNVTLACKANELPAALAKYSHTLNKGMIIGPVAAKGSYSLYKVTDIVQDKKEHTYKIAVIEKKAVIGDYTRNKLYEEVKHFANQVKNLTEFETLAAKQNLLVHKETVYPSDESIGRLSAAHDIVGWLFSTASVGKISEVFHIGDAYVLGVLTNHTKTGDLVPLETVFHEVYQKVVQEKKAKFIVDKIIALQLTSLEAMQEAYKDSPATLQLGQKVSYQNNKDSPIKEAKFFTGYCFGLPLKTISCPIVDETGVFVAYVHDKHVDETDEALNSYLDAKKLITEIEQRMQNDYTIKAMEESAKITNPRYKLS